KWAKPLYDALVTQFNTVLLTRASHDIAHWWLKRERIAGWSRVLCWPQDRLLNYSRWRYDEIQSMLADGFEVALYLATAHVTLERVRDLGVLTLTMSYPSKAGGWRDPAESAPRPWAELASGETQEVEHGLG